MHVHGWTQRHSLYPHIYGDVSTKNICHDNNKHIPRIVRRWLITHHSISSITNFDYIIQNYTPSTMSYGLFMCPVLHNTHSTVVQGFCMRPVLNNTPVTIVTGLFMYPYYIIWMSEDIVVKNQDITSQLLKWVYWPSGTHGLQISVDCWPGTEAVWMIIQLYSLCSCEDINLIPVSPCLKCLFAMSLWTKRIIKSALLQKYPSAVRCENLRCLECYTHWT